MAISKLTEEKLEELKNKKDKLKAYRTHLISFV
jgi:hypothetical protein